MPVVVIVFAFMAFGAIVFTLGALRMFTSVKKNIEAAGGLEGLKAAHLQMTEEHPAAVLPVIMPSGQVKTMRFVWLLLALAAVFSFGVGGFAQYRAIRNARLLQNEGVITQALVTDKRITEDDDGNETCYVSYAFDAPLPDGGARRVQRRETVSYLIFDQVEEGGRIEIIYARSDPTAAQIKANYKPGKVSYLPLLIGSLIGLATALLALPFYRRLQNAVRLDAEGVPITATVLDLFASSGDADSAMYYVAYALPDGQRIRHTISAQTYKQLHVGDSIQLVYLPDNPRIFRPEWERPEWA
ncbi:MAG TPA: hypothetical protein PKZ84_01380 [Anaerolineae bacterium]|nr:hypothetical protein [Anaerolineae bacterium]HQI83050.1 hypothetical protein [Anaerolineae bacterium]